MNLGPPSSFPLYVNIFSDLFSNFLLLIPGYLLPHCVFVIRTDFISSQAWGSGWMERLLDGSKDQCASGSTIMHSLRGTSMPCLDQGLTPAALPPGEHLRELA